MKMDSLTFLYDVQPLVLERFCRIMDGGGDALGWRGLAVRIVPNYAEVRRLERLEAAGRSPTRELLWSWAQQNPRVRDLLTVLQDMGQLRALQLFQGPAQESPVPARNQNAESKMPAAGVGEPPERLEPSSSSPASTPVTPTTEPPLPVITLQDVIEGTRVFHHEMRIAEGNFADVYRAHIGSRTFAVKLFKQIDSDSWKKLWEVFRKEMEIHHAYKHPNILDLLCCFSDEGQVYCLVYPYLPDGSLHHRLHRQDGEHPLSWEERLAIIKGIAKALHHLHTAQPCPVICGNISSSNILLDEALQPKLSDFGLARLRPPSASQYCTITLDTGFISNRGYVPEEHIRHSKLSISLDVYSFGMVIMETMTGQKVIGDGPRQTPLRDVLFTEVEDSGGGVDGCLQFLDPTAGPWPTAMALRLLDLAMSCTASRHRHRPGMDDVLLALSKLLPPPRWPPDDQPHSLEDGFVIQAQQGPSLSIPVEHDEQRSLPGSPAQAGPFECSQSEVTYLSDNVGAHGEEWPDLYSSYAGEDGGQACRDSRSAPGQEETPESDLSVVENEAKVRLRNKLSLYNKGLIDTEELFSGTGLRQGDKLP